MRHINKLPKAGLFFLLALSQTAAAKDLTADEIIKGAIDHERDISSYSLITMQIHRPDWQRTMIMKSWTKGSKKSLVRVVEPKKDAGAGNLLLGNDMWSYVPNINRVIKLPSSMMNQSWMGSDFTNNDLAKADDIVKQYNHSLESVISKGGKKIYKIKSVPKESAPVVWGKEVLTVRDDYVLLEHDFYDQDGKLVKKLVTNKISTMDGKTIASEIRMQKVEHPEEWTQISIQNAKFGINLPDRVFTLSNLRNPRQAY